jgi:hypothetical protein
MKGRDPLERDEIKIGAEPISKTPYMMKAPKLCELQMQLKELVELGIIRPSFFTLGCTSNIFQEGRFLTTVYRLQGIELYYNEY